MSAGYVKVWRKIRESGVIQNHKACALFIWLLTSVCRNKQKFQDLDVLPGELITTINEVGIYVNLSRQEVRSAIEFLESLDILVTSPEVVQHRMTRFKILNWAKYQLNSAEHEQPKENPEKNNGGLGIEDYEEGEQPWRNHGATKGFTSMNKNEENKELKSKTTLNSTEKGITNNRAPQRQLKEVVDKETMTVYELNYYPPWDLRWLRARVTTDAQRAEARRKWVEKFGQEPIPLPDLEPGAILRGEYGDVALRHMWEDMRGQELARRLQQEAGVAS